MAGYHNALRQLRAAVDRQHTHKSAKKTPKKSASKKERSSKRTGGAVDISHLVARELKKALDAYPSSTPRKRKSKKASPPVAKRSKARKAPAKKSSGKKRSGRKPMSQAQRKAFAKRMAAARAARGR